MVTPSNTVVVAAPLFVIVSMVPKFVVCSVPPMMASSSSSTTDAVAVTASEPSSAAMVPPASFIGEVDQQTALAPLASSVPVFVVVVELRVPVLMTSSPPTASMVPLLTSVSTPGSGVSPVPMVPWPSIVALIVERAVGEAAADRIGREVHLDRAGCLSK